MSIDPAVFAKLKEDPIRFVKEIGPSIGKGRLLGCESIEQGELIALMMITDNLSFLDVKEKFHVMGKELSLRAEWMRAELRRRGGDYDWVNKGEDGTTATIKITFAGKTNDVSYTIEDAKREKLIKKDGAWELRPGDMLRARVTTKAVRMHASEILSGFATDEELAALNGDVIEQPQTDQGEESGVAKPLAKAKCPDCGKVIESGDHCVQCNREEPEPAATPPVVESKPAPAPKADEPKASTKEQRDRIKELFVALEISGEKQEEALKKRGANALRNLTNDGAAEILAVLEGAKAKRDAKAAAADKPTEPTPAPAPEPSAPNLGPCSNVLAEQIRDHLKKLQDKSKLQEIRNHLGKFGKKSITDLTVTDAELLLTSLTNNNLAAFFEKSLDKVDEIPF